MNRTPNTRRGFTLVELLVVVLILAILMAVALPLYLNAIRNSEKGTARANMQTIANAEQSYKLGNSDHAYTEDTTKLADLTSAVTGPGDRAYTVTLQTTTAACKDGNGVSTPVPPGSFSVHTTSVSGRGGDDVDGCFIPGATPN